MPGRGGGFNARQVRQECAALGIEASDAGQECDAGKHKCHLCFRSASELETGANHFLVAARVEFGTGNRHVPFFPSCPRGVPRGVPLNPGVTTGLKEAILG